MYLIPHFKNGKIVDCYEYCGQLLLGYDAFFHLLEEHHIVYSRKAIEGFLKELGIISHTGTFSISQRDENWYALQENEIVKIGGNSWSGVSLFRSMLFSWGNFQYLLSKLRDHLGKNVEADF